MKIGNRYKDSVLKFSDLLAGNEYKGINTKLHKIGQKDKVRKISKSNSSFL